MTLSNEEDSVDAIVCCIMDDTSACLLTFDQRCWHGGCFCVGSTHQMGLIHPRQREEAVARCY